MAQGNIAESRGTFNQGPIKRDLSRAFNDLCDEFKREAVNGNITLHFALGCIAKIHSTKVF